MAVEPAIRAAWRWPILGAVSGLLLALVLFLPEAWVTSWVGNASGQRVLLANAQGTIWNGSAVLVFTGGEGRPVALRILR